MPASVEVRVPEKSAAEILIVAVQDPDRAMLCRILSSHYTIVAAGACREAAKILEKSRLCVVLCDGELPDGTWRDVLTGFDLLPHAPLLIVTSRLADERLWAEVLNVGGFDLLAKPFEAKEVLHVVRTALLQSGAVVKIAAGALG